jgi:polyketide synthase Type III
MFVQGLGLATPAHRYTKADCWASFRNSDWFERLDPRSRAIAETVLTRDNGIEARWLAVESLDEAFVISPDILLARFTRHAPKLAATACRRALDDAHVSAQEIDAVVVSTCTGYLCPALSGYVIEHLGLRADVQAYDLVGQGCAAAVPNWRIAETLVAAKRAQHVLSVCVEVSSAAMYLDNDPGVLISACLFGDGAGAAVLSQSPHPSHRRVEWKTAGSLTVPSEREALRFEHRSGLLRNVLTRRVPQLAAEAAQTVMHGVLSPMGLGKSDIQTWIWHAGGRDVLNALCERMQLQPADLSHSAATLREYGNLSSAFLCFVLCAALEANARGGLWWMSSFGAGFSCHGALLEVA